MIMINLSRFNCLIKLILISNNINEGTQLAKAGFSGRRGGLVVSVLDSGSRGPGSSPGRVIVLFF